MMFSLGLVVLDGVVRAGSEGERLCGGSMFKNVCRIDTTLFHFSVAKLAYKLLVGVLLLGGVSRQALLRGGSFFLAGVGRNVCTYRRL